jgi:hypothetical protein
MRRPRAVTFLAALVFLLGLLQCARAANLFIRREFLQDFNLSMPLPYAIGSAAVWGGLLWAASAGLWWLKPWGRRLALAAVTASQVQAWIDHFLFDRSDYAALSAGFKLVATLAVLAFTWGLLWWTPIKKRFEN